MTTNLSTSIIFFISDVFIESMNVSGKIFNEVQWNVAKFSFHPNYITFYKNFGGNLISAVFPLVALGFLNYLVYKHLAKRRRRMSTVCSLPDFQRSRDFKSAASLLSVAISFVLCQSVKIIPDIYELRNCDYLKVSFHQITYWVKHLECIKILD